MVRLFICLALATLALATDQKTTTTTTTCEYPPLYDATLEELEAGLANSCFTSTDLVTAYFARIGEVNDTLHVVQVKNPDALDIAKELDAERAAGKIRGPLHGIPILIKDNIATFDKMDNTAGSYALVGARVPRDSTAAAKLRAAGAIILGKTTMSEWAQYRASNWTSGWSPVGGQVYGPYYAKEDPYGSSSGSAIASGLGLSAAALGTETHGSIIMPAERANSVGIKPTVGLTSRYLVVPITQFQDTVGPIARTVRDAATMLSVVAGVDKNDNYTNAIPNGGVIPDYVAITKQPINLKGLRIGVPRNIALAKIAFAPVNDTYLQSEFEKAIKVLEDLGATVISGTDLDKDVISTYGWNLRGGLPTKELQQYGAGFISGIAAYFSELTHNPQNITSLADLVKFTKKDPRENWPRRDMIAWQTALLYNFNASSQQAYKVNQELVGLDQSGGVTGIINRFNLSALIVPTEYAATWAAAPGLPAVTVPMGAYPPDTPVIKGVQDLIAVAPGIPFGLTFLGKAWSEEMLIRLAYAYEQTTLVRGKIVPGANGVMPKTEIKHVLDGVLPAVAPSAFLPESVSAFLPEAVSSVSPMRALGALVLGLLVLVFLRGFRSGGAPAPAPSNRPRVEKKPKRK